MIFAFIHSVFIYLLTELSSADAVVALQFTVLWYIRNNVWFIWFPWYHHKFTLKFLINHLVVCLRHLLIKGHTNIYTHITTIYSMIINRAFPQTNKQTNNITFPTKERSSIKYKSLFVCIYSFIYMKFTYGCFHHFMFQCFGEKFIFFIGFSGHIFAVYLLLEKYIKSVIFREPMFLFTIGKHCL